jgi:hypothetical protein
MKWVGPSIGQPSDRWDGRRGFRQQTSREPVVEGNPSIPSVSYRVRAVWAWAWRILLALALVSLATFALYSLTTAVEKPSALYPGEN